MQSDTISLLSCSIQAVDFNDNLIFLFSRCDALSDAFHIALVRRQYSGNAHGVIKGIGVVTCVYVKDEIDRFWVIYYRIYDPDSDGKTKLDHIREMLSLIVYHKRLPFYAVLMDSWYATKDLMLQIEKFYKRYYCPLKENCLVDDSNGLNSYKRIDALTWTETEIQQGKRIKIKGFPKDHKVSDLSEKGETLPGSVANQTHGLCRN